MCGKIQFRVVLNFILFSGTVFLIGCDQTAEDMADEISQEIQDEMEQQAEDAWEAAQQWFQDQANAIWDEIKGTTGTLWDDAQSWGLEQWEASQTWLGLEVPSGVGDVAFAQTEQDHATIKEAFVAAYSEYKLWQSLGDPDGPVSVYGDGLLIQYYEKDDVRSAIVMRDDSSASNTVAYAIPRQWFTMYEALGGPEVAGYPSSKPESYFWLWDGKRQVFVAAETNTTFALFQAAGSEDVFVVPPDFYKAYQDMDGLSRLGYPLSNMPLDNNAGNVQWRNLLNVDDETEELLEYWWSQPYRIQIFEKGSLWYNTSSNEFEVVEKMALIGGDTKLSGEVGSAFAERFTTMRLATGNECYEETLRHMANAANGDFGEDLLHDLAFLPLESTLASISLGAETISAKVGLLVAEYFLNLAKEESFAEANKALVAGLIVDAFYEKAVGDYLAFPLSEITLGGAELQYEVLQDDRLLREIHVTADSGSSQLNMNATMVYDPLTNVVSGVIFSESQVCQPATYIYQFRLSENPTYNASFILQSGDLIIYDLATGKLMP